MYFHSDSRTGFSDSSEINGENATTDSSPPNITSLRQLSQNLETIFESEDFDFYTDAKITVRGGQEVAVHRCVLAARSPFFRKVFGGKERVVELGKEVDLGLECLVSVLGYMYSGKVKPCPPGVCVCVDEDCLHLACRPAIDFMVELLYASFTFQISELVALYQRHILDILDKVETDDILVVLSVANKCYKACERLVTRCIEIVVKSNLDNFTLEKSLPQDIVKRIIDSRIEIGLNIPEKNVIFEKHVKRIHSALDSDDVELVRMLLTEAQTTLDDSCALHYAVAHCDAKTTTELLDLGLADVNHRNSRGYTVLHVAAMRKEPKIIVSLLTKGARPSDLTSDGKKALQISKRLTRAVDYYRTIEEGKDSPKDRLCIEILDEAERREPLLGEASFSLAMAGDDLRVKLLYLENRVMLAKLLFPMEAKVAMDIAQVDGTSEFRLSTIKSMNTADSQRTTVDLNETPFKIQEEHLNRLRALSRTVELGKRYFPRCSNVVSKLVDIEDLAELATIGNDSTEERNLKKKRYMEIQEALSRAFTEDKEELDKSTISSSSSSISIGVVARPNGKPMSKY